MSVRYHALATDYDGTLATAARVGAETVAALTRLRASGRRLVLVTGRIFSDLAQVFPEHALFDVVVAENGGVSCRPGAAERLLAEAPSPALAKALRARGVPFDQGRVVIATREPHDVTVLEVIRELGLELDVIFNKGAVMVLPSGVNKRTGLEAALAELGLTAHEVVALGDAENDHTLLAGAELGVAVENALPALKERADLVTRGASGAGVEEVIAGLLADDLAGLDPPRHRVALGEGAAGALSVSPAGTRLLVAGTSGSGKSTFASGVLEKLVEKGYQVCLVDPEGDFEGFQGLTPLGSAERTPSVEEVVALLAEPGISPAVSLLGLPLRDRPRFLTELWPKLQQLRARSGRPHWLVVDEAHHMFPRAFDSSAALPRDPGGLLLVTVHPDRLEPEVLRTVNAAVAVGEGAAATLSAFFRSAGLPGGGPAETQAPEQALLWTARSGETVAFRPAQPRAAHQRHRRKYASGDVHEKAFRFRGPDGRLDLRAQNLELFLQLADGVDDETWRFHLENGDYSRWFREAIKDEELARDAAEVERSAGGDPRDTRKRLREAVERRYVVEDAGAVAR
ncbi:MAG TPA: HAD hydrolase family protein [Anaeromyxobacteraceae bacterium]|nr:HAD hydrolase family protein [Anaeromyxobacteraceae bacterium]